MASLLIHPPPILMLQHLILLIILIHIPSYLSSYEGCTNLINCGKITNIGFPFWGQNRPKECGHPLMQLTCQNGNSYITIKDVKYQVLDANPNQHMMRITRVDYLQQGLCPSTHVNTTLDTKLYVYESPYINLTLFYGCSASNSLTSNYGLIPCIPNEPYGGYVFPLLMGSLPSSVICKSSVVVPVSPSLIDSSIINDGTKILMAINNGFEVRWILGVEECNKCESSGEACGIDLNSNRTSCYCRDGPCSNSLPDEKASTEKGKGGQTIIILITVPAIVVVTLFFSCYYLIKRKPRKSIKSLLRENFGNESDTLEHMQFNLAILEAATNNFSDENRIGKGGFGEVYKGILFDGRQIAVKRLSTCSMQGTNEFKNEVLVIAKLQHRNLVTLIGFCLEGENKILIYEYVSNKSLDYFLFDSQRLKLLNWSRRYNIIGGIARGILYLHEHSRLKVIHRDLKPSNVLLDENMIPKISDFGLARIVEINQNQKGTNKIAGTFGYMPPEYAMFGQFSEKSDAFSFGVMVLEIITGKKNLSSYEPHRVADGLLSYVWRQWRDQMLLTILDPSVTGNYSETEVIKCIQISLLCVQQNPDARPTMTTFVSYFSSNLIELPTPQEPAFFVHDRVDPTAFAQELSVNESLNRSIPFSVNKMSISEFYPR